VPRVRSAEGDALGHSEQRTCLGSVTDAWCPFRVAVAARCDSHMMMKNYSQSARGADRRCDEQSVRQQPVEHRPAWAGTMAIRPSLVIGKGPIGDPSIPASSGFDQVGQRCGRQPMSMPRTPWETAQFSRVPRMPFRAFLASRMPDETGVPKFVNKYAANRCKLISCLVEGFASIKVASRSDSNRFFQKSRSCK
jgi:hypothetical protein